MMRKKRMKEKRMKEKRMKQEKWKQEEGKKKAKRKRSTRSRPRTQGYRDRDHQHSPCRRQKDRHADRPRRRHGGAPAPGNWETTGPESAEQRHNDPVGTRRRPAGQRTTSPERSGAFAEQSSAAKSGRDRKEEEGNPADSATKKQETAAGAAGKTRSKEGRQDRTSK
jgi:hypothetical protein